MDSDNQKNGEYQVNNVDTDITDSYLVSDTFRLLHKYYSYG